MEFTENKKGQTKNSFFSFMERVIERLRQNGQYRTCQHYRSALNSFKRFRNDTDFSLHKLNAEMVESYEAYLKRQDVCRNTSSFYMRILRAVYNRAVERKLAVQRFPFRHVYTGIDKTRKRAIPFDAVRRIRQLDLSGSPSCEMAKDVFLLCFCLRGISFVDLAHLKKTDIHDGYLHYNRSKTRQKMTVKWEPQMQELVDKYSHLTASSPYLLPFLQDGTDSDHRLYHNAESRIVYQLKKIRRMVGLQGNLTLYVARHSWATAARNFHTPVSVISEALGHDSELTTQIYLSSIQTSEVDKLNADILEGIFKSKKVKE